MLLGEASMTEEKFRADPTLGAPVNTQPQERWPETLADEAVPGWRDLPTGSVVARFEIATFSVERSPITGNAVVAMRLGDDGQEAVGRSRLARRLFASFAEQMRATP